MPGNPSYCPRHASCSVNEAFLVVVGLSNLHRDINYILRKAQPKASPLGNTSLAKALRGHLRHRRRSSQHCFFVKARAYYKSALVDSPPSMRVSSASLWSGHRELGHIPMRCWHRFLSGLFVTKRARIRVSAQNWRRASSSRTWL